MIQLCMGIPYGAPDDPLTLMAMVNQLPPNAIFSAFSISRNQLPYVAMRRWPAAMSVSVWKTTSIWAAANTRPTASSWPAPRRSWKR
ncbi:MAG: 3-keto-5-aminohexanoate cleavage protein [Aliidongia sp.]